MQALTSLDILVQTLGTSGWSSMARLSSQQGVHDVSVQNFATFIMNSY
jgi:hypothetical protein